MNLYPAIDLYQGEVVRLVRGDYAQKTVYSSDPGEIAKSFEDQGARWIHVVDLEGAKDGELKNLEALKRIRESVQCNIEFGGGLRSLEAIQKVISLGVNRAIIGTKAMDEEFLKQILDACGSKIAIGLDVRNGRVQMEGWLKEGGKEIGEAIERLNEFAVETIIYTDIQKDGMLQGPNFGGLDEVLAQSRARIILSGGVGELEDVRKASQIQAENFEGVIVGKAIYEKRFSVEEAAKLLYS